MEHKDLERVNSACHADLQTLYILTACCYAEVEVSSALQLIECYLVSESLLFQSPEPNVSLLRLYKEPGCRT